MELKHIVAIVMTAVAAVAAVIMAAAGEELQMAIALMVKQCMVMLQEVEVDLHSLIQNI